MIDTPTPAPPILPDLGNLTPQTTAMLTRIVIVALTSWLGTHATMLFPASQDAQIATEVVGAGVVGLTALWGWLTVRWHARQAVAAAATGNPKADPSEPATQAKVAEKIADPTSPIVAADPAASPSKVVNIAGAKS